MHDQYAHGSWGDLAGVNFYNAEQERPILQISDRFMSFIFQALHVNILLGAHTTSSQVVLDEFLGTECSWADGVIQLIPQDDAILFTEELKALTHQALSQTECPAPWEELSDVIDVICKFIHNSINKKLPVYMEND